MSTNDAAAFESAFVGGATGYTGRAVVAELRRRGLATVAHVRPDSPGLAGWRERFAALGAEVDATAWDEEALTSTLRERAPSHVFALLGTTARRARAEGMAATEAYERIDYGLTALLIRAAAASGSRPRFVYLSSIGVREGASSPYLRARVRAEADLRASGLPHTIVRPAIITGEDRDDARGMERAAARVGDGALAVLGFFGAKRTRDRYRSTTGGALAAALVRLALDPAAANRIVHGEELRAG